MDKPMNQTSAACKPLTTFVQTDTNAFREVVQRLTGPSQESDMSQVVVPAPTKSPVGIKRSTSKLHERRHYMRPKLEIVKPPITFKPCMSPTTSRSPRQVLSPAGTPSRIFSKLTLVDQDIGEESSSTVCELNTEEEERAIKERRFYLHPSPRSTTPRFTEPELLPLFPLASPKSQENVSARTE